MSEDGGKEISRRDFLKLAGVVGAGALGGWRLNKLLYQTPRKFDNSEIKPAIMIKPAETVEPVVAIEPLALTPEVVDGVEVYGLKEKITSVDTVERFYAYLDGQFGKANNIQITDKIRQRKEVLNPNERYLEVVVRRSAYDSFIRKQAETRVSFPEWIRIHIDVMNRCLQKARPQIEMKAVLRRILVVEDEGTKSFWDENAYRQGSPVGSALDWAWVKRFWPYSTDTDESWAVADDYRDSGGGFFWEVRHENGKTIMGMPPGRVPFERYFEFPEENDSLSGKNNVSFDMGLIHEWSHYLLNLPDEYAQDVHDSMQRFRHFIFGTESFHAPYFSPYLAYLMRENIKLKARACFTSDDRRLPASFNGRPREVGVTAKFQNKSAAISSIAVRRVRLLDNNYYGSKSVPEKADQVSGTGLLIFDGSLFRDDSNCWLVRVVGDQKIREVFLPAAAITMSKFAGLESAKYNLIFSGYDDTERTIQEVKLVDEADIDQFLKDSPNPFYAKMKVEGTSTWFVWFLRA